MDYKYNNIFIILFYLSSIFIFYVNAQNPTITGVLPSWGPSNQVITIRGSSFGPGTPTITAGSFGCPSVFFSDIEIRCQLPASIPPQLLSIVVVNSQGGTSVDTPAEYGVVTIGVATPYNSIYNILGDYSFIPTYAKDKIYVQSVDGTIKLSVFYYLDKLAWIPSYDIFQLTNVQVMDGYTEKYVFEVATNDVYAPVSTGASFFDKSMLIYGYLFTAQTIVYTFNPKVAMQITSWSPTSIECQTTANFFDSNLLDFEIVQDNGVPNRIGYTLLEIISFSNDLSSDGSTLVIRFIEPFQPGYAITGLSNSLITPTLLNSTRAEFNYPLDAQCGKAYISFLFSPTIHDRMTNSLVICPSPTIQSFSLFPNASNNHYLTFTGKFLNNVNMATGSQTLSYSINYYNANTLSCTFISQTRDSNDPSIYTTTCQTPSLTSTSPFMLTVSTITGQTSDFLVGENPIIDSITRIDYGVPGEVTIKGSGFTPYNLFVTIGGSTCTNIVSSDVEIKCTLDRKTRVIDFSAPLEVIVSIDATYITKESIFYFNRPNPIISQSSQTVYSVPDRVEIVGNYLYTTGSLEVYIGGSQCTNAVSGADGTTLNCDFKSDVFVSNYNTPLEVSIVIDTLYSAKESIFKYYVPSPTIISSSSTVYSVPEQITIVGNDFYNSVLVVKVGGSVCSNAVASDTQHITCLFQSNIVVDDINTPLEVFVGMGPSISTTNSVFYYIKPITVTITSSTSTKYGTPAAVTIVGSNFINDQLFVTIGGSQCTNAIATQDGKQLTCNFNSDVVVSDYNTPLNVFISIQSRFNATEPVFLYTRPDKVCPIGNNGQVCSGHGICNQKQTCDCDKGWYSLDCSLQDNGGGTIIPDPSVNPNDTSSTIITPGGTMFDVGIVLINEVDSNNNIIQSFNITSLSWNNITKGDYQYSYTTILQNKNNNSNSTLNVLLSLNPLDESIYYNFAGDIIPILPKSIKYQVELHNYTFSSSLNTMQFIFKSGIIESGECVYDENTSTQESSNSIRSIQMRLNGETLIGTFSDRIVLDNRPSYNQVNKLTNDQITKYNLSSSGLYVSVTTTIFKQSVIVDPNFGVLITSKPDDSDKCKKKKFASWKIALIVVLGVVGVAGAVTTVILLKKRKIARDFSIKLSSVSNK